METEGGSNTSGGGANEGMFEDGEGFEEVEDYGGVFGGGFEPTLESGFCYMRIRENQKDNNKLERFIRMLRWVLNTQS